MTVDSGLLYERVLREGGPFDVLAYVDGALLVDLWDELVLPRGVRAAWHGVVTGRSGAEGRLMAAPSPLTGFQIEVARLLCNIDASQGYLVAGGAALPAANLISRPNRGPGHVRLMPITSVTEARDEFLRSLRARGYEVSVPQDGATFCRMIVGRRTTTCWSTWPSTRRQSIRPR